MPLEQFGVEFLRLLSCLLSEARRQEKKKPTLHLKSSLSETAGSPLGEPGMGLVVDL